MTYYPIACIQMDAIEGDNLETVAEQISLTKTRYPWVKMIVLSELLSFGSAKSRAEPLPGPTENFYCELAKEHGVWLVNGSLYEQWQGEIYNTASVINDEGEVIARHRKLYPFLPYEKGIACGDQHTVFDVPEVGRFGLSICYDGWFPETTRALVALGAEVIIHPTLTDTRDRDVELTMVRANAVTNQCYFVDVNASGELALGQSLIVGPEGDIVHQAGRQGEIFAVELDIERVRRTRENGILRLGQVLKSFRDGNVHYPQYEKGFEFMPNLGELKMPE